MISATMVASLLMVTPLSAYEHIDNTPITINDDGQEVRVYNTDTSSNVDLNYASETYTINVHIRGNWELLPDETTASKDEGGNIIYSRYDANYDDEDFTVTIDAPSAINVVLEDVTFNHDEANDHLTARVDVKFQRNSASSSKLWCYKTFSVDVDQLEIPIEVAVETNELVQ